MERQRSQGAYGGVCASRKGCTIADLNIAKPGTDLQIGDGLRQHETVVS